MDKCLRSGRLVPRRIIALNISTARCCTADGRPVQGSSGDLFIYFFFKPSGDQIPPKEKSICVRKNYIHFVWVQLCMTVQ